MGKGKNKRRYPQSPTKSNKVNLEKSRETSATANEDLIKKNAESTIEDSFEKLPPPFQGDNEVRKIPSWNDLSLILKVTITVGSFFIAIIIPIVIFGSGMQNDLGNLHDDIKEIKIETAELIDNSNKYSERLYEVEKNIAVIGERLPSQGTNK